MLGAIYYILLAVVVGKIARSVDIAFTDASNDGPLATALGMVLFGLAGFFLIISIIIAWRSMA